MNKFITSILIIFTLSFSSSLYANDADTQAELDKSITLEVATHDLMNRFVFAFFGQDALQNFEPRNISDLNEKAIFEDLQKYASPFPYLYIKINFIFYIIYYISLFSFIGYLSFIIYMGIFRSQSSGSFLGESWNTTYMVVKIFLALFLLAPIAGDETLENEKGKTVQSIVTKFPSISPNMYSVSQVLAFKVAGYSNFHGKAINNAIIDNQTSLYPSLALPQSDSKMMELKNLLNYLICTKTNLESSEDVLFNTKETDSGLSISSSNGKCSFGFTMGVDFGAIKIINENPDLETKIPNFKNSQIEIIKELTKNLVEKADLISTVLISQSTSHLENVESRFSEYTKNGLKSDTNSQWENNCDDIFNYTVDPSSPLLKHEAEQYAYMGLRCLSYEINKKILLPNVDKISSFLKNGNYLKERKIELCTQDYTFDSDKSTATLIGDSDTLDTLNITSDNTSTFTFLDIDTCLENACSNLTPTQEYTNLYSCSNAILLYKKINEQKKFKDLGIISLSANLFRIFSTHNPLNAKSVYNNITSKESNSVFNSLSSSLLDSPVYDSSFTVNITKKDGFESLYEDISIYDYAKIESNYYTMTESGSLSAITKFFRLDKGGVLGSERLFNCAQYPMTYHNGFNCGSITEEYNLFGKGLLSSAIQYKTMGILLKGTSSPIFKKTSSGNIKETSDSFGSNSMGGYTKDLLYFATEKAVKFFAAPIAIDFLFNNTTETDDFGDFTSKDLNLLQYNEELAAFYAATVNNEATEFLDLFFNILMYVGILFAYIIPFYPFFIALTLFLEWFLLFFNTLILIPFCSVYILKPSHNHTNQMFSTTFNILISLFLKIPFLMIGLILGWVLANTVISRALALFDFSAIMSSGSSSIISNIMNPLVMLLVYGLIIFMFTNIALTVIEKFYSFATDWIVKVLGNTPMKESPTGLYGSMKRNVSGAKNTGSTNLGGKLSQRFGVKS